MIDARQFFANIVQAAPAFQQTVDEHLVQHQTLLAHVLMGDCGRFIGSYFTSETTIPSDPVELRKLLAVIDAALIEGDEETINAIAVSFVEHLWLEPYFPGLQPFLGPGVRDEIDRQRS
jgi:hypothetical protein